MARSCADMVDFTDDPAKPPNAEYLLTVNVAKEIRNLNYSAGDPYDIRLEEHTEQFARNCLFPSKFVGHPLAHVSTKFRLGTPKINRNGRIDVAVYENIPNNGYFGAQPICAIELKGLNPKMSSALSDMRRNLEFFRVSGNTGGSVLRFSIFAALHSFKRSSDEDRVQANEVKLKEKYQKALAQLGSTHDISVDIQVHTISKELVGRVLNEGEHKVLDTSAIHHFAGIIVTFRAKEV